MSTAAIRTGRKGNLNVGNDSIINCRFSFDRPSAKVTIGDRCFIGKSHIVTGHSVDIGDDVLISWGVTIVDHDSHAISWEQRANDTLDWHVGRKDWSNVVLAPVVLERRCWVGFNAIILKGITIGEGAIVGAGSVVTRDVAPYTVVAGNPAREIRKLDKPNV